MKLVKCSYCNTNKPLSDMRNSNSVSNKKCSQCFDMNMGSLMSDVNEKAIHYNKNHWDYIFNAFSKY